MRDPEWKDRRVSPESSRVGPPSSRTLWTVGITLFAPRAPLATLDGIDVRRRRALRIVLLEPFPRRLGYARRRRPASWCRYKVVLIDPRVDLCRRDGALFLRQTWHGTRFPRAAPARPRCPCARSAWCRAGFCGSAASAACADRQMIACRSHGRPCRHRSDRSPCDGRDRCRLFLTVERKA